MAEDSDLEKTEEPTPHKREKAKKDGQIVRSKELSSVLMILGGVSLLWMSGRFITRELYAMLTEGFTFNHHIIGNENLLIPRFASLMKQAVFALSPVFLGLVLVAIGGSAVLGGINFSSKSIKFDPKKWNPISGLKRIFSMNALAELFKAILKSLFVGLAATVFLWHNWNDILHLITLPPLSALANAMQLLIFAVYIAVFMLIPMVAFDIIFQIRSHLKKLRMTRQEIKDEFKQQEGDPQDRKSVV